jgi:hypothetical protein
VSLDPRIAAAILAGASLLFAALGLRALAGRGRRGLAGAGRRRVAAALGGVVALALLLAALLCAALAVSVQGYRALTREEIAATIEIEPIVRQRFVAHVTLADGRRQSFQLAGDELYVDARVLKWHPFANLLGLHTQYALDRISGRYADLEDERHAPRTIFSLVPGAPLDAFVLRRKHELLAPLVDASYGSGTFGAADRPVVLEVRVGTSGLLLRERAVAERARAPQRAAAVRGSDRG